VLQQRLGRKRLTAQLLHSAPVVFVAYDLLEQAGQDLRQRPQAERRERLQALLASGPFAVSPRVQDASWPAVAARREAARELGVEGLMLKRLDSAYGVGRTRTQGLWLKWKTEPMVVDGVLVYAQAGHGRRASLYTDYTFAVWNRAPTGEPEAQAVIDAIAAGHPLPAQAGVPLAEQPLQLVAFAKAYSGLSDAQFKEVDAVIRRSTLQKFGPVRSVRPSLVFELAFEGIQESRRHKSGVALRFPRMTRLRTDKPLHEANTLADLQALIALGQA
jgi:DNA ligase-1